MTDEMLTLSTEDVKNDGFHKVVNWFRSKSMWMLYYCTGCGAIELPPTMTSRFDMGRFGMGPMATPRQADLLLITGYVSVKTLKRIVRSYEQMPTPKYVVGFGACAINGGIYWDSYAVINKLERFIPIDMFISGCMPRPQSILDTFQKLFKKIQKGEALGWKKYEKNYEWYKKNQDSVLKRTEPVLNQ